MGYSIQHIELISKTDAHGEQSRCAELTVYRLSDCRSLKRYALSVGMHTQKMYLSLIFEPKTIDHRL
jgi:hypothetical protein